MYTRKDLSHSIALIKFDYLVAISLFAFVACAGLFYGFKSHEAKTDAFNSMHNVKRLNYEDSLKYTISIDKKWKGFSEQALVNKLQEMNVKHIDIVLAQAWIESGHYNSNICRYNYNLFGMKLPGQRPTLALGKKRGHAYYNNWEESVIDYALWQTYCAKNLSHSAYIAYLKRNYAESNYKSVESVAKKFKAKYSL